MLFDEPQATWLAQYDMPPSCLYGGFGIVEHPCHGAIAHRHGFERAARMLREHLADVVDELRPESRISRKVSPISSSVARAA